MFRLTRLTDYGILLTTRLAQDPSRAAWSARRLAAEARIPVPTASKVLKILARRGVLAACRGPRGGFHLARSPRRISVTEVVSALQGPPVFTPCGPAERGCGREGLCRIRGHWRRIGAAVLRALRGITLAGLARPLRRRPAPAARRKGP